MRKFLSIAAAVLLAVAIVMPPAPASAGPRGNAAIVLGIVVLGAMALGAQQSPGQYYLPPVGGTVYVPYAQCEAYGRYSAARADCLGAVTQWRGAVEAENQCRVHGRWSPFCDRR